MATEKLVKEEDVIKDYIFGMGSTEEEEMAKLFNKVLSALNKEQLPLLGRDIFRRVHPQFAGGDAQPVLGEPMYGSNHVLFPLTFHTGLRWLVKIPVNGTVDRWDELSAASLASEAKTMQLLKRETTIPIPEVLDFSSTTQNALQCPYILLSYISGLPLYDVWFGHHIQGDDPELNRARRIRILDGIASAMAQLGKFSFRTSGSLTFADDGSPSGTGPLRRYDLGRMLDRWRIHHNPAVDPIYASHAASDDPKSYYTFMLDLHPQQHAFYEECNPALLRQLIIWIPEPTRADPFGLAHPDFDMQNFIVSEDGELLGIIDWDGVAAVPHSMGNMGYPSWLTRDWDPIMYEYEESMDQGVEPYEVWEDSPATLAYYRRVYKDAMVKCQNDENGADICRMSLITKNLALAAYDPHCRSGIVDKVAEEIWSRASHDGELDFEELALLFAKDKVDAAVRDAVHRGFNALLIEEGL